MVYYRLDNIKTRMPNPPSDADIDEYGADVDAMIDTVLRAHLGKSDVDDRQIVLPFTAIGTVIQPTNKKDDFLEVTVTDDSGNGTFTPSSTLLKARSITLKDSTAANQRLDSLDGYSFGDVICFILQSGETVDIKHNTTIGNRFINLGAADKTLSEDIPVYYEKRNDANGGSWFELAALATPAGFNTITIPMDLDLQRLADDTVIGLIREDNANEFEVIDRAKKALQIELNKRFGYSRDIPFNVEAVSQVS